MVESYQLQPCTTERHFRQRWPSPKTIMEPGNSYCLATPSWLSRRHRFVTHASVMTLHHQLRNHVQDIILGCDK